MAILTIDQFSKMMLPSFYRMIRGMRLELASDLRKLRATDRKLCRRYYRSIKFNEPFRERDYERVAKILSPITACIKQEGSLPLRVRIPEDYKKCP